MDYSYREPYIASTEYLPRLRYDQAFTNGFLNSYNPETVSIDYDEADRLHFENIANEIILPVA